MFRNDLTPEQALHLCTTTEGQVDIVTQVSPQIAQKVIDSNYARLINVNGNKILVGIFNRFKRDVDFTDSNLRLALNLAINRNTIIQEGFFGFASKVPALTPPWASDFPEGLTSREYDAVRARQLFMQSGWKEGRRLKLASTIEYEKVAYIIASQIQQTLQISVDVTIYNEKEEFKLRRMVAEKKLVPSWDILLANTTALYLEGTPAFFHREFFGTDGALRVGPKLNEFDLLFNKMVAQVDKAERVKVAKEIDRYVFEEALGLFICSPQDLYAVNRNVIFRPYRTSLEFADTEVNDRHWSRRNFYFF